jgi:cellulose synthase/poly-beta-1,6-N-acetylglucosamine synthase-like glycosyltransferase
MVTVFDLGFLVYLLAINSLYLVFSVVAYFKLVNHRRRWTVRELDAVMRSPATPAISIIVPGFNEEATIVESVRSLLALNYPQFEVIVINDGSTDGTLMSLIEVYGLISAPVSYAHHLPTQPIRGVYRSLATHDVVVIDKVNGGKADAINAGISAAQFPLVCVIDADSLLEEHALVRVVLPFIEDPDTIAAGGIIRIANGCGIDHGRVTDVRLSDRWLVRFQVVEYLRAFLAGRVTLSALDALLIISGAFGVFRRDVLLDAGGFSVDTVGEDMELVTRLHRFCRDRGLPCRIAFQPDPVCWTEVPESARMLARQRNRWQRGTLQVLGRHSKMIANPRYGRVGLLAMPYYLIFEALGPLIECGGYVVTALGLWLGLLDWNLAQLLFIAAVMYGTLISVASVLLEDLSFRHYRRVADFLWLVAFATLENFGYRQLTTWWRVQGSIDFLRGQQAWGTMTRKGFARA